MSREDVDCLSALMLLALLSMLAIVVSPRLHPQHRLPQQYPAPTPYDAGFVIDPKKPRDLTKDTACFNASVTIAKSLHICATTLSNGSLPRSKLPLFEGPRWRLHEMDQSIFLVSRPCLENRRRARQLTHPQWTGQSALCMR